MEGANQSSNIHSPQSQLPSATTNVSSATTGSILPRLQLGSNLLPLYPNVTPPAPQVTEFKSRFLPKHQKERSPLSPDRSVSSVRFGRTPFFAKASLSSLRENEESSSPHLKQK